MLLFGAFLSFFFSPARSSRKGTREFDFASARRLHSLVQGAGAPPVSSWRVRYIYAPCVRCSTDLRRSSERPPFEPLHIYTDACEEIEDRWREPFAVTVKRRTGVCSERSTADLSRVRLLRRSQCNRCLWYRQVDRVIFCAVEYNDEFSIGLSLADFYPTFPRARFERAGEECDICDKLNRRKGSYAFAQVPRLRVMRVQAIVCRLLNRCIVKKHWRRIIK